MSGTVISVMGSVGLENCIEIPIYSSDYYHNIGENPNEL